MTGMRILPIEKVLQIGVESGIFPSFILGHELPKGPVHDVIVAEPGTQVDDKIRGDE